MKRFLYQSLRESYQELGKLDQTNINLNATTIGLNRCDKKMSDLKRSFNIGMDEKEEEWRVIWISNLILSFRELFWGFGYDFDGFVEIFDHEACWIIRIILLRSMNSSLSEERVPADSIGTSDVSPRVIPHHKKHSLRLSLPHLPFHKLKSLQLRLPIVNMLNQIEIMPFAMLIEHIIERAEGNARLEVASCPDNVVLGCKIGDPSVRFLVMA